MSGDAPGAAAGERALLAAAVARLEAVTARLQEGDDDHERLAALADEALELSAEIGERLPRVIREIEDTARGAG